MIFEVFFGQTKQETLGSPQFVRCQIRVGHTAAIAVWFPGGVAFHIQIVAFVDVAQNTLQTTRFDAVA